MTEQRQTLLVHAGCIALLALCVWLSTLIKGTDDLSLELRAALVGSALFLWGKLGFKPANPVLDRIVRKLVEREPVRVARLTSKPPPSAAPRNSIEPPVQVSKPVVTIVKDDDDEDGTTLESKR